MYYTMSEPGPAGWIMPLTPFHFTLVQNVKRDPFESACIIHMRSFSQQIIDAFQLKCARRSIEMSAAQE
jgi:hypothetical protein